MAFLEDPALRAWFRDGAAGGPALFLDRDGVIVEEVGFLRRAEDVRLLPGMAAAIRAANEAGVTVCCVTNQSGIARGRFGWDAYDAVTAAMNGQLHDEAGARLDAILACGHHPDAASAGGDRHGWRKPAPGMLFAARDRLRLELARSTIIGDRLSDLEAGQNAGLMGGILVLSGYGAANIEKVDALRDVWRAASYRTEIIDKPDAAVRHAMEGLRCPPNRRGRSMDESDGACGES